MRLRLPQGCLGGDLRGGLVALRQRRTRAFALKDERRVLVYLAGSSGSSHGEHGGYRILLVVLDRFYLFKGK